ncbi:hypothetical protein [Mycobacterium syngnathidarum]|uniref:hypothetical protein n=1 Tax=Mycobacterium syngnathidarum TaxID=1908205 RepID=UPI00095B0084|nr:hypothetical protein [Mycobacterium syngnathidarum]OLT97883.1 hypothetical protein BKG60_03860 [Mycobacterium syngnathidarum]
MSEPAAPPAYPNWPPPPYPPPTAAEAAPRRRWPAFAGGAAIGAVLAAAITAVITTQTGDTTATPATITATATPPAPTTPAPLPAAEANRHTCDAWVSAGDRIHDATAALSVIPQGTTVLDPAVRGNPEWSAAVQRAADQYKQAGDKLSGGIAPGTTTILNQAATTAAGALRTLSSGYGAFDPASGNTYFVMRESADTMDALCNRLAPR